MSTPAAEVVTQQLPDGTVVAGAAAEQATGQPLDVEITDLVAERATSVVTVPASSLPHAA